MAALAFLALSVWAYMVLATAIAFATTRDFHPDDFRLNLQGSTYVPAVLFLGLLTMLLWLYP